MGGEIEKFIKVWISVILGLCYCYYIASKIPKGFMRLVSILPILCLFIILPLNLSSPTLVGSTSFFLWLATFKLILFSFNQGPLALPPNILYFLSLASLPITPKQNPPTNHKYNTTKKLKWLLLLKLLIFAMIIRVYEYQENFHPNFTFVIYGFHVYLSLELIFGLIESIVRIIFGFEIEPHFNEPYLSTSLQDFWGRRWNLMASLVLRSTIYNPIRGISTNFMGPSFAKSFAMFATFLVSGLMHELIYYHLTRATPTWEVTWFFVLHGVCTVAEVEMKKVALRRGWQLHRSVSGPLVVAVLAVTAKWLVFPQLLRNEMDKKFSEDYSITVDFVKSKLLFVFNNLR